jgi:hypothetical protein
MPEDAHAVKWAYRICNNAWIDEIRSRDVRQKYPHLVSQEQAIAPSAEHIADGEQALESVGAALDMLPIEQRLALTLVAIEGKTYAEAADGVVNTCYRSHRASGAESPVKTRKMNGRPKSWRRKIPPPPVLNIVLPAPSTPIALPPLWRKMPRGLLSA